MWTQIDIDSPDLAEGEGFEPPDLSVARFQGGCIRPLCHPSRLRTRLLADLPAHARDPLIRCLPRRPGVAAADLGVFARGRVRPEELETRQRRMEVAQAVGHHFVVDVTL